MGDGAGAAGLGRAPACRSWPRVPRRLGPLDLRGLAQVRDERGLRLLHDVAGDLILDLVEGRKGFLPLVQDLDDMPAERAFHRIGNLTHLQLERGVGEFRHHPILGEPAEIAAFRARVFRHFLGDRGESPRPP